MAAAARGDAGGESRLAGVARYEPDQVVRQEIFKRRHPAVFFAVLGRTGPYQAIIPRPSGSDTITRETLGELLDRLDEVIADD